MFCEKCGKEVNDGQRYCAECDKYENSSKVQGILAIVLSGASIVGVLPLIGAIVGIVFGVLSRHTKGEKLGQAGIIVGIISVVIAAVNYIGSTILCVMILIFYIFVAFAAYGSSY
jgi:hypothetical protein